MVILVFALGYGLYTRQGSGVNKHPRADSQDPVIDGGGQDDDPSDERAGVDQSESGKMDQRGTQ